MRNSSLPARLEHQANNVERDDGKLAEQILSCDLGDMVLVLREATEAMYRAALRITRDPGYGHCHDAVGGAVYRAMIAAAPEPPAISDDLISRLRELSRRQHDDLSIGDEAADMIEGLSDRLKELERLYRERTELAEAQRRRAEAVEARLAERKGVEG